MITKADIVPGALLDHSQITRGPFGRLPGILIAVTKKDQDLFGGEAWLLYVLPVTGRQGFHIVSINTTDFEKMTRLDRPVDHI